MNRRYLYITLVGVVAIVVALLMGRSAQQPGEQTQSSREPMDAPATITLPTTFAELYDVALAELDAAERDLEVMRLLAADEALVKALEVDTLNVNAVEVLGRVRFLQSRFEDAAECFHYLLFKDPMRADIWGSLGDVWLEQGQYRFADSCYAEMMRRDSGYESLLRAARGSFELHDFDSALELSDRALVLAVETNVSMEALAGGHIQLGHMLIEKGYWEEARRNVDIAMSLAPDAIAVQHANARLLALEGDVAGAKQAYRVVIQRSPHPTFKSELAKVCVRAGEQQAADSLIARAARDFDRLVPVFPERMQREQVAFLVDWGLEPERASKLAYRVSRKRADFYTYELLARAYSAMGQHELAWSSISLALRRNPQHPRVFHTAAVVAKAAGKLDKFETYSTRARMANPRAEELYGPF